MKTVGIIGGSGYTGGELIRLVVNHPALALDFVYSTTRPGTPISDTHQDLLGTLDLNFTDKINPEIEVLFLCLGHGNSSAFLEQYSFSASTIIIDLSNDFRLNNDAHFSGREFIYGLPETNKTTIEKATAIANPGCFATAIQLALLPLAKAAKLTETVHVNATTGSTGAGVSLSPTTHFTWRNNNLSWYKPFTHQHLGEIGETIGHLQGNDVDVLFLPQRGDFTRGIFASAYTKFEGSLEEAYTLYNDFYKDAPFTQVAKKEVNLKLVVNTNQCFLHLHKHGDQLLITAVIDNLIKGASGQAIQNLNLIMGWEETLGLQLKASIF
ncbi:MAG: N-acetyl-gamma-glutamyl-phosphate reductase [Flavobacteriaceae bacterium]|nr:N-acetyl-gamma-glutamyl-phosphate reductase [Flavobacteriaceae bacterium]